MRHDLLFFPDFYQMRKKIIGSDHMAADPLRLVFPSYGGHRILPFCGWLYLYLIKEKRRQTDVGRPTDQLDLWQRSNSPPLPCGP
ncbi:hypothetical protein [Pandoravirus japonicus]|uniref:Uncharacterized protein n=1 Tax=Pandoravirus japonicus TaxID=2823154 RepID=A0A811BRA5_9VIRU|nr:hypothetical protein [Pandoravirus japonicus]